MKRVFSGLHLPEEKGKTYAALYLMTAIVHLVYMGIFIVEKCRSLWFINAVLIVLYLLVAKRSTKVRRFGGVFIVGSIAMVVFLISHYVLLGPSFGFQYLSVGMIPFMFYLAYVNESGFEMARIGSLASYIVLCAVIIGCSKNSYPMLDVSETSRIIIFFLNLTLTFFISTQFMTEFVRRSFVEAGLLENKNLDLEKSANIDALTGLQNRRTVESYIDKALYKARGEGKNVSFLMCDIDNFKHVNDTYGHDCGDQVLKSIAGIIKSEVRPDDAVFRWGGEEMLMVIYASEYVAKAVGERCRKAVEESSVVYGDNEIKVTITIGGSTYYQGATRDDVINRADKKLYEGKHNGKNQVVM